MADFCTKCSLELFDKDFEDLARISTEENTKNGLFANAICEGCGFIQLDHTGKCISEDCLEKHNG